jgi:tetratricopeptide (TPR) repeat protein
MWKIKACALVLGVVVIAATARACFLGTPWQLTDNRRETLTAAPTNSFAWEVSHWVPASRWVLAPADKPLQDYDWMSARQGRAAAENAGLQPEQQAALTAMRAASGSETAVAAAGDLPDAIRFYTAGAVAFANDDLAGAAGYFNQVLGLPDDQAASRVVWAQFMLGRIAAKQGQSAIAEMVFAKTRTLTAQGASDPLGLATASLGESARLRLDAGNISDAVLLYAEQAADGSYEAVESLQMVARDAMANQERLPALVSQPDTQRLLVAYALALTGDYLHELHTNGATRDEIGFTGFYPPDANDLTRLGALLRMIRTSNVVVAEVDRLAALAYRLGDYQAAEALAERNASALALWIRAKISLQGRDRRESARLFAAALRATADEKVSTSLEPSTIHLLRGEAAVMVLSSGDFVQAATVLWPVGGTYWGDLAYLAERVLTTDELKVFVEAHAATPEHPNDKAAFSVINNIRGLLARRLMRENRYEEALPYFDQLTTDEKNSRANAVAFAGALSRSRTSFWALERAKGAWDAAVVLRTNGMKLMGTTTAPDYGLGGWSDWGVGPTGPPVGLNLYDFGEIPFVQDERVRYDASRPRPDLRFHYRYLAVEQALAAADNLPPRGQAFAAILCQASGWMMSSHADEKARALYVRYVRDGAIVPFATHFGHGCPEPDFSAVSTTQWKLIVIKARDTVHQQKAPVVMGGVLLLLVSGLGGALWLRRKS